MMQNSQLGFSVSVALARGTITSGQLGPSASPEKNPPFNLMCPQQGRQNVTSHYRSKCATLSVRTSVMSGLHIVALGSSFAAGPGIPPSAPGVPPSAGQSAHNYSHLLAARLGAGLTDLSCSGATLRNVLDEPQKPPSSLFPCRDEGTIMPPQVDGVPANADIVTLTAGGNDMGYSWAMALDAARAAVLGPPKHYVPRRRNSSRHADLHVIIDRFTAVIDAVKRKAPGATVYLVQYVDVLGPETRTDAENPLSQARKFASRVPWLARHD